MSPQWACCLVREAASARPELFRLDAALADDMRRRYGVMLLLPWFTWRVLLPLLRGLTGVAPLPGDPKVAAGRSGGGPGRLQGCSVCRLASSRLWL
jgi:hypothetical protein